MTRGRSRTREVRLCLFCGEPGQMTKEHAWPRWLGRDSEVEQRQYTYSSGFSRSAADAYTEHDNTVVIKPGSVLTARIREVCASCNNGWMSRLEEQAAPLLARLWTPSYPFGLTAFSAEESGALSRWATKTAWVRENAVQHASTPAPEARRRLMLTPSPPAYTHVWAARHQGEINFAAFTTNAQVSHRDHDWDSGQRRSILMCVLVFRGLALMVRTDSGDGVPFHAPPTSHWQRMWPTREGIVWPPGLPVTDAEAYAVGRDMRGWLTLPLTGQFHRSADWTKVTRN